MDYKNKYMKYKQKYLQLRGMNHLTGGFPKLIIHISGPSGAGKTTLGKKLKEKYHDKIVVKDIDDLRAKFISTYYGEKEWDIIDAGAYQKFIDKYIAKIDKPLILVGLNNMPWWHKDLYYDMHSKYNYYIDIDDDTIIKQKCIRDLTDTLKNILNDKQAMEDMVHNNKKFIRLITKGVKQECDASTIIEYNTKWKKDYAGQGYLFMSRDDIYDDVCAKIDNFFLD